MESMQCPICGKMFDVNEYKIDENGNPVCPECYKVTAQQPPLYQN